MQILTNIYNYIKYSKYSKWIFYGLAFLLIYGYNFYSLGNTLYRTNASGYKVFSIVPLFTEGFIGPLRTLFIMGSTFNLTGFVRLLLIFMTNFWSPYAVILFLYLIENNLII